jgi:hypothetical protein
MSLRLLVLEPAAVSHFRALRAPNMRTKHGVEYSESSGTKLEGLGARTLRLSKAGVL